MKKKEPKVLRGDVKKPFETKMVVDTGTAIVFFDEF